jgi:transcriptional regulator with XRE-family HTH domain
MAAANLGERVRKARLAYGMSQAELARRIGLSYSGMNAIEMGNTDPRASRIKAISDILHVSADYLLGRTAEDTEETDHVV